ncbi:ribonuclease H-like domain, gag-pre-integrase domain protein [Tanacetum coccineum]
MLAYSLLPIPFWAEAVNTACYVLNRVLVTKPQNKTPYELLIDEGYLLGYSTTSKAFRVYNKRTKRVEEKMHIDFLEDQPNVAGSGPDWMFNLDFLTNTMNYIPVSVENHVNVDVGTQEHYVDSEDVAEKEEQHMLTEADQALQDDLERMIAQRIATKTIDDATRQAFEEEKKRAAQATSINKLNTGRPSVGASNLQLANLVLPGKSLFCLLPFCWCFQFTIGKFGAARQIWCCQGKFWNTASSQTVNDVKRINATVDSKAVVVTEASIICFLLFNDADGTACLTNEAIFQSLALMGYEGDFNKLTFQKALFSPQWKVLALESIKDAQAAEISALKSRIKKMEKKCKPSISHHRAWLKSVHKLSMKKRFGKKESISKQGRKKSKPESTLDDSTVFDDQDHGIEYMETEEAVDEGRQSVSTARPEVSATRPDIDAARQEDSAVEPKTPPTTISIFNDEDITMAQKLIKMKEKKAKEKGVSIKDVDDSSRPERSILTLKPLPIIDPKDKGKGVLKESPVKKVKRSDLDAAQIAKDAKIARLDKVQAKMDASEELVARLQNGEELREEMYTIERKVKQISVFFNKEEESYLSEESGPIHQGTRKDADFMPIGSERDEKMIDKINKKAAGMDEEEVPESTKVEVKKEGHEENIRKRSVPDEEEEIDYEVLGMRYPIVNWESAFYHTDRYGVPHDYYRVFRANGSSRYIKTFTEMVSRFDRLDFIELHNDDILKNQEKWIVKSWTFYENYGVHIFALEDGTEIYMLAERRYPLIRETLKRMMELRLTTESEGEAVFDLLRFILNRLMSLGAKMGCTMYIALKQLAIPEPTTGSLIKVESLRGRIVGFRRDLQLCCCFNIGAAGEDLVQDLFSKGSNKIYDSEGDILFLENLLKGDHSKADKSEIYTLIGEPPDTFLMEDEEIKLNPLKNSDDSFPIPRVSVTPLDSLDSFFDSYDISYNNPSELDSKYTLNYDNPIFNIQNKHCDEPEIETIMDKVHSTVQISPLFEELTSDKSMHDIILHQIRHGWFFFCYKFILILFSLEDNFESLSSDSFELGDQNVVFDPGIFFISGVFSFTRKSPHLLSNNFMIDKYLIFRKNSLMTKSSVSFHPKDKEIRGESS